MNIPEITNEIKSTRRTDTVAVTYAEDRQPPGSGDHRVASDAVQRHSAAQGEKEPQNFSREDVEKLVEEAEKQLQKHDVKLKFNILEEDDTVQVEIVDPDGKTIRKIPDDDMIKLSQSLKNLDRGFLDQVS